MVPVDISILVSLVADTAFRPVVEYRWMRKTMKKYKKKAILPKKGVRDRYKRELEGEDTPEHYENIGYMIHVVLMDEFELFVCGGHE
jgi:hypothetical protein